LSNTTAQPGGVLDYEVEFRNIGDANAQGEPLVVTGILPAGLTVGDPAKAFLHITVFGQNVPCTRSDGSPLQGGESTVRCETTLPVFTNSEFGPSGGANFMRLKLSAAVDSLATPGSTLTSRFSVEGGGAPPAAAIDPVRVSLAPPPFGIDAFD